MGASGERGGRGGAPPRDPAREAAQRRVVEARLGPLTPSAMEAIRRARGREFQRLEFIGDSILEVVLHAHAVMVGPACPYCEGRADRFTTDAHLGELAAAIDLGDWLDWTPSEHRMADLVEGCVGAAWVSGRWPQVVEFVDAELHPLPADEQRRLLHGGAQVHPEAPPGRGRSWGPRSSRPPPPPRPIGAIPRAMRVICPGSRRGCCPGSTCWAGAVSRSGCGAACAHVVSTVTMSSGS